MEENTSSIKYVGKVTITLKERQMVTYNNGTSKLFNILNSFISKNNVLSGDMPTYIMLYQVDYTKLLETPSTDEFNSFRILNTYPLLNGSTVTNTSMDESVVFTSDIDSDYLKTAVSNSDLDIISIAIVSADTKSILAAASIADGKTLVEHLRSGKSVMVKWQMSFDNYSY